MGTGGACAHRHFSWAGERGPPGESVRAQDHACACTVSKPLKEVTVVSFHTGLEAIGLEAGQIPLAQPQAGWGGRGRVPDRPLPPPS